MASFIDVKFSVIFLFVYSIFGYYGLNVKTEKKKIHCFLKLYYIHANIFDCIVVFFSFFCKILNFTENLNFYTNIFLMDLEYT